MLDDIRARLAKTRDVLRAMADATANEYDPPAPIDETYLHEIDATVWRAIHRPAAMRDGDLRRCALMLIDIWPHYKQLRNQQANRP